MMRNKDQRCNAPKFRRKAHFASCLYPLRTNFVVVSFVRDFFANNLTFEFIKPKHKLKCRSFLYVKQVGLTLG